MIVHNFNLQSGCLSWLIFSSSHSVCCYHYNRFSLYLKKCVTAYYISFCSVECLLGLNFSNIFYSRYSYIKVLNQLIEGWKVEVATTSCSTSHGQKPARRGWLSLCFLEKVLVLNKMLVYLGVGGESCPLWLWFLVCGLLSWFPLVSFSTLHL